MDKLKRQWRAIASTTAFLLVLCLFVTAAVSGTHLLTADRIAQHQAQARIRSMERLLPADRYDIALEDETGTPIVYAAIGADGRVQGHLISTGAYGYSGVISIMTAIVNGQVTAIEILDATAETPGLGQHVLNENFTAQFQGLTTPPALIRGVPTEPHQIQGLSGATISAEAVVQAVRQALDIYDQLD